MRLLLISVLLVLSGCGDPHIQTEILSPVCIKPYKGFQYKTCAPLRFTVNNIPFQLDNDFITDLASVPRLIWPFISPFNSPFMGPSIIHDGFYSESCYFDRKDVDLIFYAMLRNNGVSLWRANQMYYAVRIFGWVHYNGCKRDITYA
jgi:hypothetical protein